MTHTILLWQSSTTQASRTFYDYENVTLAVEAICSNYEQQLKQSNPTARNITYDISELFAWIDSQHDLACLVYDATTQAYRPHPKDWIKQRIYNNLKQQVGA
eukprot:c7438_g1_i1.p1 GENE.c7438_g1_i1~~c7438_g1_i1.p1  ORF type:complete len:102 (+),score=23.28 c7438_g1_i1:61-366(+)